MSKDLYNDTRVHFGIDSVENLIANRRHRFINLRDMVKQTIVYIKCCADPVRLFGCIFHWVRLIFACCIIFSTIYKMVK